MKYDLTNQRFGKLLVLRPGATVTTYAMWWCVCDCGNKIIVKSVNLTSELTKSCGCLRPAWTRPEAREKEKQNKRLRQLSLGYWGWNKKRSHAIRAAALGKAK